MKAAIRSSRLGVRWNSVPGCHSVQRIILKPFAGAYSVSRGFAAFRGVDGPGDIYFATDLKTITNTRAATKKNTNATNADCSEAVTLLPRKDQLRLCS